MMWGGSQDYPSFPEIESQIGYNPARFLDHEIETTECTKDLTVTGLIRGIQDIAMVRAWITVEVALERGRNDGPRQQVIKWLNRRQAQIETDTTDSPSTTAGDKSRPTATEHASTKPASDGTPEPALTETTADAINGNDTDEAATTAVATDGGAPDPDTSPQCPDCHGKLPTETVDDEAAWCAYCGALKSLGGPA